MKFKLKQTQNGRPMALSIAWLTVLMALVVLPCDALPQGKSNSKMAVPAPQPAEDPLAHLLRRATEAIDKMDFNTAIKPLQEYIAQRPDDAYAHFQLGYAYAGLKRSLESKSEFSRALTLDPKMGPAHLNLGLVLMDTDPAAAAESFRHAAELSPSDSRPRFLVGLSLEHVGKLVEAIEQYRTSLVLDPRNYEIQFALGRALLRNKDAPGAELQFAGAVAARANSAPARLGLANSLLDQKKYQAASDAYDEYFKLNPEDPAAHFDRAAALFNLDRFDAALVELDRAVANTSPSAEILKMRGDIYTQQKNWKEAQETLTQAVKLSPQDSELAYRLGHTDIELHDYPAAIGILGRIYKQNPQSRDVLRDLANVFFLHEDYAAALGAMDQLNTMEPPLPGSWFVRAICYDKLSRKVEAIDAYQKFLDQDNGQHDTQDFQARHRLLALQKELGQKSSKQ
jgi:tetratricopeptide (TPR) repeat protein